MEKKLISLEDYNNNIFSAIQNRKNGIACPTCGEELEDVDSTMILLSYPAKTTIICSSCGYRGYRNV